MEHHSHCSDALKQKLTAIKKTIRNKFKSACANRLECERDAGHAMKPLLHQIHACNNNHLLKLRVNIEI